MSKQPVIYTVSIKLARKDGKPIVRGSKADKLARAIKEQFALSGWEVVDLKSKTQSPRKEE